jgi:hypothetical protein
MTSDDIQKAPEDWNYNDSALILACWLKEIAYQLAVMNERNASADQQAVDAMLKKVGLGSKVGAGSETEVRGGRGGGPYVEEILAHQRRQRQLEGQLEAANQHVKILQEQLDERTTPPNPQTSSIQRTSVPDDSSEI